MENKFKLSIKDNYLYEYFNNLEKDIINFNVDSEITDYMLKLYFKLRMDNMCSDSWYKLLKYETLITIQLNCIICVNNKAYELHRNKYGEYLLNSSQITDDNGYKLVEIRDNQ